MPDMAISVVSHNQRQDLERLLPSLCHAASLAQAEILLVDNCSQDGTCDYIQQDYPWIHVTRNQVRAGYGANHNVNLGLAKGRFFVIMNTDMTVMPNVFTSLRDFMDMHADTGIVSPRILNPDGSIQGLNKRYPTIWDLLVRGAVPKRAQRIFQSRLNYYEMRDTGYDHVCDVPFLSGAFMFSRTDLLKDLGGFDEKYFLYFEDADLCRRVQRTHRTAYFPGTSVTHFWKRASRKNLFHTYYFIRSGLRYFGQWGYRFG